MKYNGDEARSLKAYGELPENTRINETDTYGEDNTEAVGFEFDEERSGSEASEVEIDDI
jgi:translation initiation factor 1A